jgi:hypothetical protein
LNHRPWLKTKGTTQFEVHQRHVFSELSWQSFSLRWSHNIDSPVQKQCRSLFREAFQNIAQRKPRARSRIW